jgi:hypothetical protein
MSTSNAQQELALIYFKVAHTGENAIFEVPTNICTKNFIEFAKNRAYETFQIDANREIEIVEAGQNIPGVRASEDAPAFVGEFDVTVREKFNGEYTNLAFYVRYREIVYINNQLNITVTNNNDIDIIDSQINVNTVFITQSEIIPSTIVPNDEYI